MNTNVYDAGRVPDVPRLNEGGKPPSQKTNVPAKARSATWLVPALLMMSAVPLAAGAVRLTQPVDGPDVQP